MFRSADKWLVGYLRSVLGRPRSLSGARHLLFCVADHFEPFRNGSSQQEALDITDRYCAELSDAAMGFRDADGRNPRHTFFYPQEDYNPACIEKISGVCRRGLGEVEIHLHHRNDTAEGLRSRLILFRDQLRKNHGLLGSDSSGASRYGFVHGNWALCNSRPDGDWCGVNEELGILRETGCYADLTFPSAPSPTQPGMINAIYYASDTGHPRACDRGRRAKVTSVPLRTDTSLMLITGPLALDWRRRKWGLFPRLENSAITTINPPVARRVDLWVRQHIHVSGCPSWIFVKVHMHGCNRDGEGALPVSVMRQAFEYLKSSYNDGRKWLLHFVTAREMYNIVRAAETGKTGDPGEYRDFEITCPPALKKTGG